MTAPSSQPSDIIALPPGGGALQGIGEKFSPDLHSGTGNFSVPIATPPGRHGLQPALTLAYSTGRGNGPFGLGWSLSIPGVSRKTAKGVPRYDDARDTFILSGAEDLAPLPGASTGATRYRPRTEGPFVRIEHRRDGGNDYWEVRSQDGLVSVYGTPERAGADPAVVADPVDRRRVQAWNLSRTVDSFGNRLEYEYERDHGADGPHEFDQLYLRRIRYVDYTEGGADAFLVSVTFVYEDRPDPFSEYRGGFEARTRQRCVRIETRTHAGEARLVRTVHLVYLDQRVGMESALPLSGVSLLSRITVVGHDDGRTEELPPLDFDYTRFEPQARTFARVEGSDLPAVALANPDYALADLFGHGLPDILHMNGTVRYWRNLGGGRFDLPREMPEAPAGLQLAAKGVQLLDADGDGRTDLMVVTEGMAGYFPLRFDGLWDRRSFQRYRQAPSFDLNDPEVRLLDLDGDGVTDALRSGTRLECFFNDAKDGWTETRFVERQAVDAFPNVNFSDPRVRLADMTGDGLQDVVLVHDGSIAYWPNLGRGNWGRQVTMRRSPRLPEGFDPRRLLLGDLDGDGAADVVLVEDTRVTLWINQCGNGWSDPRVIKGTPPLSDVDAVRLSDLGGNGVSGILWSSDAGGRSRGTLFFLDLTGGTKPYLLAEIDNHLGALTRVDYAPSTRFYLEDEERPATRWKTPLPFPVHVVARVGVVDAISVGTLTTEYRYHHGYWDGAEREFRGFGRVDQRDTEAGASSPPLETRTWFHQGPVGDESDGWQECDYTSEYWPGDPQVLERPPGMAVMLRNLPHRARRDALRALRGSILRTELYALDGTERQDRPYTVSENLHGVREESPGIFFPHVLAQRTTQWERGNEPMTQFQFADDYDAYGQARSETSIAVPRGRDPRAASVPGQPYLATHAVTTYAHRDDAGRYLIGRAARITTHEIGNDGSPDVFALYAGIVSGAASRRVIGQTLNFFDGPAFEGLPFGQLGDHGIPSRSERLVLSEDILGEAYPAIPPYMAPAASPAWTAEYPQEFRDGLPPLAGHVFQPGGAGSEYARGYFTRAERRRYDCQENATGQGRGLPTATRDPLGRDTTITYDVFDLLPTETRGPTGLTVRARHDYRMLQPREVTDANGNRRLATYTPLGLVASTAVMGKEGEGAGDTPESPSVSMVYDFLAFTQRGQPISVRTIRRVHHASETDVPPPERDDTIETVEYSDGFGRLLQTRTQADDVVFGDGGSGDAGLPAEPPAAPGDAIGRARATGEPTRVVVSGWQIYDNKGRVVEKYEPFFSTDWPYSPPTDAQLGQKARMEYDPRGEVVRTVNPDGSEQRVVFGIPPADLAEPDRFAPTPWESYTYDANDNAGRTHPAVSRGFQHHWNTPASAEVDALGRAVTAIVRNGPDAGTDWLVTRSTYDIRGNVLTITDPLNRTAFRHVYDLLDRVLRSESIDAGTRRAVLDAAGNAVEGRDSKGAVVLRSHDGLNRPIRLWARDAAGEPVTLRERILFGDAADSGLTRAQAAAANLLGRPVRHYDEAGLLTLESCDFKGNVLEKTRRVIADAAILAVYDPPSPPGQVTAFRVDWQPLAGVTLERHAGTLLDATTYRTSATYDARDRLETLRYPETVDGARKELRPRYNRAGGLESVRLDGTIFVDRIAYNARGQRVLIAYGNGAMTRYAYHPRTFRLTRLRTERFTKPDVLTWHPGGQPLQDFAYRHDVSGNLMDIQDRAPGSGIPNTALGPDALDRAFTYDPLYRLLSATGRECDAPPPDPWDGAARGTDLTRTRAYTERYDYDNAGNLIRLRHQDSIGGSVRELAPGPAANRLATATTGQTVLAYAHDPNGNLVAEAAARRFEWDHGDRLKTFRTQSGASEPSVHAHYLYDAAGQRVKKLVRKQGGQIETTVSVNGLFEHHRTVTAGTTRENNTLHVMDDQRRVALVRVGAPFPGDATPAVKFHLGDHLGSSHVVVDGAGALVNREEFTPYGDTSFGSFARKRFRFTGKERDEESGLNHQGARYYAPWLARWTSCDPAGMADGPNLYTYVRNNPMRLVDPTGMQGEDDNMSHKPCECSRAPAKPKKNASSAKPPNYTPVPKKKAPELSSPAPSMPGPSTENTLTSKFSLNLGKSGPSPLDFYKSSSSFGKKPGQPPSAKAEPAPTSSSGTTSARVSAGLNFVEGIVIPAATTDIEFTEFVSRAVDPAWSASAEAEILAGTKSAVKGVGAAATLVGAGLTAYDQSTRSLAKTSVGKGVDAFLAGGASAAFSYYLPGPAVVDTGLGWLTGGYNANALMQWSIRHTVAGAESVILFINEPKDSGGAGGGLPPDALMY